jgi:hypothetical protein
MDLYPPTTVVQTILLLEQVDQLNQRCTNLTIGGGEILHCGWWKGDHHQPHMGDTTRMAAAWYDTGIGGGGGGGGSSGGKTTMAQKVTAVAAARVMATIPRGGGAGYLLGQVSLMTRAVGEAASQPAVGGRGQFWGGGPRAVWYGQWSLMMWAYTQLVRRHLSPPWEDEDDFWGEVRARYGIKNMSGFRVFAFVLPLARRCCCLWVMEVLALLLHC